MAAPHVAGVVAMALSRDPRKTRPLSCVSTAFRGSDTAFALRSRRSVSGPAQSDDRERGLFTAFP